VQSAHDQLIGACGRLVAVVEQTVPRSNGGTPRRVLDWVAVNVAYYPVSVYVLGAGEAWAVKSVCAERSRKVQN
jgi:hypothetical protein